MHRKKLFSYDPKQDVIEDVFKEMIASEADQDAGLIEESTMTTALCESIASLARESADEQEFVTALVTALNRVVLEDADNGLGTGTFARIKRCL